MSSMIERLQWKYSGKEYFREIAVLRLASGRKNTAEMRKT